MPPKIVFSKEQIIDAAFEIFTKEGLDSISVRKLAAKLGSSTAPIYTSFKNVEDIKKLLMGKSLNILLNYTQNEYTEDVFLNIGIGILEFARDYKIIYRTLFINSNEYHYILKEFNEKNLKQMKREKSLSVFDEQDLRDILEKMFFFTHGLACCLCAGMLEDESKDYFINTLNGVGGDVISTTALRKGMFERYMNDLQERSCYHEKDNHFKRDNK